MEPSTNCFASASDDAALDDFPVSIAAAAAENNNYFSPPSSSTFENESSTNDVIGVDNTKEREDDGDGHGNNNADNGMSCARTTPERGPDGAAVAAAAAAAAAVPPPPPSSTSENDNDDKCTTIHAGYTYIDDGADVLLSLLSPPYKNIMYEAYRNLGLESSREVENRVVDEVFTTLKRIVAGGTNNNEERGTAKIRRFVKIERKGRRPKVVNDETALASELPHAIF
jgi:hypothetical protein